MQLKNKLIMLVLLGILIFSPIAVLKANLNIQENQLIEIINQTTLENEYQNTRITISAKDFVNEDVKYIDAIILFKMGVKVVIKDIKINFKYKHLNGIEARIPEKLFQYLEKSWFINAITKIESSIDSSKISAYHCEDSLSWGTDHIDAEQVWGVGEDATDIVSGNYTGDGIKVGILDSGIDADHSEFLSTFAGGWNFIDNNSNLEDSSLTFYHGTKCAGVIASIDDDNGTIGVAPEVDLYSLKIKYTKITQLSRAIDWAIDHELDILNLSFGNADDILENLLEIAYRKGIIIVASAGNYGQDEVSLPARYDCVIGVGSVERDNDLYVRLHHMDYGEQSQYGEGLELMAPGGVKDTYTTTNGGKHTMDFGKTSAAAAFVSGICALVLEACRDKNLDVTVGDIRHILTYTADKYVNRFGNQVFGIDPLSHEDDYDPYYHGEGLVNAWDAIDYTVNEYQATDSDGDGLSDEAEDLYGTDDELNDTDGDGMRDGWEFKNCLDPFTNDADEDPDEDLISNLNEYLNGTDPFNNDTDSDGLSDYAEIITFETNPNNEDTDGEGLSDYEEIFVYFTDPLDTDPDDDFLTDYHEEIEYGTDPFNNDTDGDGILDSVEAIWGTTDPLDPDSDGDDLNDGDEQSLGTDPNVKDSDGDGMWDGWEVFWGFNPLVADSSGNPDQDGLNNAEEFAANTNPFNNDTDGDGMRDGWEVNYNMDPTNPANWDNDPDGDGIINLYEYLNGTNPRSDDTDSDGMTDDWELLYGLDPTEDDAQGDLDGDGLKNVEEFDNNTDPTDTDSDDDEMDDDWEVENNLNPLSNDASLDPDSDGLTNLEEYTEGTNPRNDDCDNDNLEDGEEVNTYNTDPWDADSDDDDMPDGWEVNHDLNPLSSTDRMGDPDGDNWRNFEEYNEGTDPQNADTDGDGMDDGWELTFGTNPLVADNNADPDNDDLVNEDEYSNETDPFDVDTDGDGFSDGVEVNIHGTDPTDPNDYPYSGGGAGGFG